MNLEGFWRGWNWKFEKESVKTEFCLPTESQSEHVLEILCLLWQHWEQNDNWSQCVFSIHEISNFFAICKVDSLLQNNEISFEWWTLKLNKKALIHFNSQVTKAIALYLPSNRRSWYSLLLSYFPRDWRLSKTYKPTSNRVPSKWPRSPIEVTPTSSVKSHLARNRIPWLRMPFK